MPNERRQAPDGLADGSDRAAKRPHSVRVLLTDCPCEAVGWLDLHALLDFCDGV